MALRGVFAQAEAAGIELIVVDNASTDATAETAADLAQEAPAGLRYRVLTEPVPGLSRARNTGLDAASAPLVVFLDDDARPHPGWAAALIAAFAAEPAVGIVGGRILPLYEVPPPPWTADPNLRAFLSMLDLGAGARSLDAGPPPVGANLAFRVAAIAGARFRTDLGRSGKNLLSNEEGAFIQGLGAAGWRTHYAGDACVDHFVPRERLRLRWVLRRSYWQGVSDIVSGQKRVKLRTAVWESLRLVPALLAAGLRWHPQRRVSALCRALYRGGIARASWAALLRVAR